MVLPEWQLLVSQDFALVSPVYRTAAEPLWARHLALVRQQATDSVVRWAFLAWHHLWVTAHAECPTKSFPASAGRQLMGSDLLQPLQLLRQHARHLPANQPASQMPGVDLGGQAVVVWSVDWAAVPALAASTVGLPAYPPTTMACLNHHGNSQLRDCLCLHPKEVLAPGSVCGLPAYPFLW